MKCHFNIILRKFIFTLKKIFLNTNKEIHSLLLVFWYQDYNRYTLIYLKSVDNAYYKTIDLNSILNYAKRLVMKKVAEKEIIPEIFRNSEKTKFTEECIKLHFVNENCSFCGNTINKDRYFSTDYIQKFKTELK